MFIQSGLRLIIVRVDVHTVRFETSCCYSYGLIIIVLESVMFETLNCESGCLYFWVSDFML